MTKLTSDDIDNIIKLYKNNVSSTDIALKYNIHSDTVLYHLKKHGVQRNRCGKPKIYKIDEIIFEKIDTIEKAYWLGLLYADGWITKKGTSWTIGLSLIDVDSMEKYRDFICPLRIIKKKKTYNGKQPYYLHITNKKIATDLIIHGCVERKSKILTFPDFLNDNLLNHFIRGYFDGDGSLSISETTHCRSYKKGVLRILSSEYFIIALINKIQSKLNINCTSRTYRNIWEFMITGNKQIDIFLRWMYYDSNYNIRMNRKYQKYQEFLTIRSNTRGVS